MDRLFWILSGRDGKQLPGGIGTAAPGIYPAFFAMVAESKNFYANCSRVESKIILRYHSQAILGLLQEWTEEDTEQLDQIVHTVFLLITTGIPPKNRS